MEQIDGIVEIEIKGVKKEIEVKEQQIETAIQWDLMRENNYMGRQSDKLISEGSLDVLIEIPFGSNMKYEIDKNTGLLRCDRILHTPHAYPFNYGFFPGTISGDGDELDAVVVAKYPLIPNTLIKCRIIGALLTTDEKGEDEKIICVPHKSVDPEFEDVKSLTDLSAHQKDKIEYFFNNYKRMEPGKFVTIRGFVDTADACQLYIDGKNMYNEKMGLMDASYPLL